MTNHYIILNEISQTTTVNLVDRRRAAGRNHLVELEGPRRNLVAEEGCRNPAHHRMLVAVGVDLDCMIPAVGLVADHMSPAVGPKLVRTTPVDLAAVRMSPAEQVLAHKSPADYNHLL